MWLLVSCRPPVSRAAPLPDKLVKNNITKKKKIVEVSRSWADEESVLSSLLSVCVLMSVCVSAGTVSGSRVWLQGLWLSKQPSLPQWWSRHHLPHGRRCCYSEPLCWYSPDLWPLKNTTRNSRVWLSLWACLLRLICFQIRRELLLTSTGVRGNLLKLKWTKEMY